MKIVNFLLKAKTSCHNSSFLRTGFLLDMYSYVLDDSFFPPVLYYKHSVFPNGKTVDSERSTENLVV